MEMTIRLVGVKETGGHVPERVTTFVVTDDGREFAVTCRIHAHALKLGLEGREGFLVVDEDDGMVRLHQVALGGGCGLIFNEERVEGLSARALRAVVEAYLGQARGQVKADAGEPEREGGMPSLRDRG
jgi:hypothetical protein